MSERVELQLPPKQYCEWVGEKGSGYRLGRDVFGLYVIAPLIGENEFDTIRDPRIVCSVGAIAWGREVKRLETELFRLRSIDMQEGILYGEFCEDCDIAEAQEAAWRDRAEGGG